MMGFIPSYQLRLTNFPDIWWLKNIYLLFTFVVHLAQPSSSHLQSQIQCNHTADEDGAIGKFYTHRPKVVI